jgi:hypothetical protein
VAVDAQVDAQEMRRLCEGLFVDQLHDAATDGQAQGTSLVIEGAAGQLRTPASRLPVPLADRTAVELRDDFVDSGFPSLPAC